MEAKLIHVVHCVISPEFPLRVWRWQYGIVSERVMAVRIMDYDVVFTLTTDIFCLFLCILFEVVVFDSARMPVSLLLAKRFFFCQPPGGGHAISFCREYLQLK